MSDNSTDTAISVRSASKMYPLYAQPGDRLKQSLWYALPQFLRGKPRQFYQEFWALRDISFEVKKGETVGIIGQNGSGKSTLLQIIAGILTPTTGEIQVNGRVAALLELGSGFNPEFTGRENVFMNGAILGFRRQEMEEKFAAITQFAQIGQFIDQPVKTYSSGMYVRLAFAVAVCVAPDILIVDEALSVGDAIYQSRSYRRMEEMRNSGQTIVLVTHDFYTVQSFCDRAILLDSGQIVKIGQAKPVVNKYIQLIATREKEYIEWLSDLSKPGASNAEQETTSFTAQITASEQETISEEFRFGTSQAEIIEAYLLNEAGEKTVVWESGEMGSMVVMAKFHRFVKRPVISFVVNTPTGVNVFGANSWYNRYEPDPQQPGATLKTEFRQQIRLNPGNYVLSFGINEREEDNTLLPLDRRLDVLAFRVIGPKEWSGIVDMDTTITYTQLSPPVEGAAQDDISARTGIGL